MNRKFYYTGACAPGKHYMVNVNKRVDTIASLIDDGEYFSIDRPHKNM